MRTKIKVFGYPTIWIEESKPSSYADAEVVMLPGGMDWHPSLYGEPIGKKTHTSIYADSKEMKLIEDAVKDNKLVVGICRGAQGITIYNDGTLIQDISHPPTHNITVEYKGEKSQYVVNSLHHQMCNPFNLDKDSYELIGYAENLSPFYTNGYNEEIDVSKIEGFKEPEIIYFKKTRCLGIQFHPEYGSMANTPIVNFLFSLIEDKLKFRR